MHIIKRYNLIHNIVCVTSLRVQLLAIILDSDLSYFRSCAHDIHADTIILSITDMHCDIKSTLAGRVCNWHSSPLLAFWHIDITMRHQIAGVEQVANHTNGSLLQLY